MKKFIVIDRIGRHNLSKRHINDAGYLVAPNSSIARSGILQYAAGSIGMTGRDPNEMISVYRSPSEVRKIKDKYGNMPVTQKHPDALEVTPETARGLQVGNSASNVKINTLDNGEVEVTADIIVTDKESIDGILSGDAEELSAGYYSAYTQKSGTAPDGTPYEVIQHSLQPNHIALVGEGRCGAKCKVADQKPKQKEINPMDLVDVEINGTRYTVTADMAADLATLDAAEKEPNKKPDGYAADAEKEVDEDGEEKAADEDDEEGEEKAADMDKEEFMEKVVKKKDKAADSTGSSRTFPVTLPNGAQGKATREVIEFMASVDSKESVPAVDHMEVARVTSKAAKILGNEFDIATCDSVDSIKKEIIGKVLPVVDCKDLQGESLAALYDTAIKTFDSKGAQFNKDQSFLTGTASAGKTVDGAEAQNPFDGILRLSGTKAVDSSSAGIISTSRKMKFKGQNEGDK